MFIMPPGLSFMLNVAPLEKVFCVHTLSKKPFVIFESLTAQTKSCAYVADTETDCPDEMPPSVVTSTMPATPLGRIR